MANEKINPKEFFEESYHGKFFNSIISCEDLCFSFTSYWKHQAGEERWRWNIDDCAKEIGLDLSDIKSYDKRLDIIIDVVLLMYQIYNLQKINLN